MPRWAATTGLLGLAVLGALLAPSLEAESIGWHVTLPPDAVVAPTPRPRAVTPPPLWMLARIDVRRDDLLVLGRSVGGTREMADVIEDRLPRLNSCYFGALQRDDATAGEITLSLVMRDGGVTAAAVRNNSTGDDLLAECVTDRVAQWELAGDPLRIVRATLTFDPRGGTPTLADPPAAAAPPDPAPPWPLAVVVPGTGRTVGLDALATVQDVVRANFRQLTSCYETELKRSPDLAGRVEVEFHLIDGHVTDPWVYADTTGSVAMQECIVDKVARWRFPPGMNESVRYPFVFERKE